MLRRADRPVEAQDRALLPVSLPAVGRSRLPSIQTGLVLPLVVLAPQNEALLDPDQLLAHPQPAPGAGMVGADRVHGGMPQVEGRARLHVPGASGQRPRQEVLKGILALPVVVEHPQPVRPAPGLGLTVQVNIVGWVSQEQTRLRSVHKRIQSAGGRSVPHIQPVPAELIAAAAFQRCPPLHRGLRVLLRRRRLPVQAEGQRLQGEARQLQVEAQVVEGLELHPQGLPVPLGQLGQAVVRQDIRPPLLRRQSFGQDTRHHIHPLGHGGLEDGLAGHQPVLPVDQERPEKAKLPQAPAQRLHLLFAVTARVPLIEHQLRRLSQYPLPRRDADGRVPVLCFDSHSGHLLVFSFAARLAPSFPPSLSPPAPGFRHLRGRAGLQDFPWGENLLPRGPCGLASISLNFSRPGVGSGKPPACRARAGPLRTPKHPAGLADSKH